MTESIKIAVTAFSERICAMLGLSTVYADYLYVFVISMIPVIELRGAIPVAFALKLPLLSSYIVAAAGNILPVPFILLFIKPILDFLKKTRFLSAIPAFLEKKASKNAEQITKYVRWGLFLFVAIPLPGTGAWTGALIASFLNFKFKDALLSISLGVLCAGVIMSIISYGLLGLIF